MKKLLLGLSILFMLIINGCANSEVEEKEFTGYDESLIQLEKACELNDGSRCTTLAVHYYEGKGVKKDILASRKYLHKACDLNDASGC